MGFLTEKFENLKKEANLKSFLNKEEINEKGREKRKLEAKKDKDEDDEKKIRQIQQDTQRLVNQQEQAIKIANYTSLGEKILTGFFIYKMTSLLCDAFFSHNHCHGGLTAHMYEDEREKIIEHSDINNIRAEHIEQMRDQFDNINQEAINIGISQDNIFTPQDKELLTDLATISRDANNPQQAELYAAKCEELGLNKDEALQAFKQDNSIELQQELKPEIEKEKEQTSPQLDF